MIATPSRRIFTDSTVWLYALLGNQDPLKSQVAAGRLLESDQVVSTQVVNEVCVNLKRKGGYDEKRIESIIDGFYSDCEVLRLDREILSDASRLRSRYGFSFYDGLIVAAALRANVATLWSEDMQHGLIVDGTLTIENPLKSS